MKIYYDEKEKEVWKLIPNSKGYCVSSFGRIKRLEHNVWNPNNNGWNTIKEHEIVISYCNSKGYARVQIYYKNGIKRIESVHRLVALAFKVNPKLMIYDQVNHLDGDKRNNHWRNLQWCTNQMNMDHSWKYLKNREKLKGSSNKLGQSCRKLTEEQVRLIPELLKTKTVTEIAKDFHVGVTTITEITHGRSWKWLHLKFS